MVTFTRAIAATLVERNRGFWAYWRAPWVVTFL